MKKRIILYILSVIFPDWQWVQIILIFNYSLCVLWKERIVMVINSTNIKKKLTSQWVTANSAISRRVYMSLLSDTLSWFRATKSLILLLNMSCQLFSRMSSFRLRYPVSVSYRYSTLVRYHGTNCILHEC